MDARTKWMRSLKVGDEVCTCRYEHKQITKIVDVTEGAGNWSLLTTAVALVSLSQASRLTDWMDRKGATIVTERIVYFADGSRCYATKCLDPVANCLHA